MRQAQAGADLADAQRGVKIGLGLSGALLHRDGVNEREKPQLISDLEKRLLGDHGTNITYESLQLQGQWSPDVFGKYKHQLEAVLGQQRAVEYEIAQTRLFCWRRAWRRITANGSCCWKRGSGWRSGRS